MITDRVDLYWFRHAPDQLDAKAHLAILDQQEIAAFEDFENHSAALSFAQRRGVRRRVLGAAMGQSPKKLVFETNSAGKPRLRDHSDRVHFNASHGRHGGVVATCDACPIGVDIEFVRPVDTAAFANRILSSKERTEYQGQDDLTRLNFLFSIWTAKEAVIKALGIGLNLNLLPQINIESENGQTDWKTATLANPLPHAQLKIWTRHLDQEFSAPAIVSIAAEQAFKVEMIEAD